MTLTSREFLDPTASAPQSRLRPIPVAPGRLPVLGHSLALFRRPLVFLRSLETVGGLVRIDIGSLPMILVTDPELTQQVLNDGRTFDKGGALFDKVRELTGDSLLTSKYDAHKRQRRLMQPAFAQRRIKGYALIMNQVIGEVIGQWRDGEVVDVGAAIYDITSRTASRTMFAADVAGLAAARVAEALSIYLRGLFIRMIAPAQLLDRIPAPGGLRYARAMKRLHEAVDEIIGAYLTMGVDHGDLLSMLLAARDENGEALSPEEIHNQVITLFLAGIETTGSSLAWSLYLLGRHPEAAALLHAEVDAILGGRMAEWEDLSRLPETRKVLTEALRLYPPGWIFTRVVMCDTMLGPYSLQAGTGLAYSPYLLHRSAKTFARPDIFNPQRWTPEWTASLPKGAFVPLGGGVHKCIGDTFGLTEVTLALAAIVSRWTLRLVSDRPVEPVPLRATLTPGRLYMQVARRK